jgi:hypothetical protein
MCVLTLLEAEHPGTDGDVASNLDGGRKRGATYVGGGQPSSFVGDAQGVSNIAASPTLELFSTARAGR